MINKTRSFICGIKGTKLSDKEILFLKKYQPWGIILFSRNIKSIKQTKNLTKSIKNIFKNNNYPILIDEEGGRVSRLFNFIDTSIFTGEYFGKLYLINKKKFKIFFNTYIKQISYLLNLLGINLNTVPVLDVRRNKYHKIISDRSYSSNPKIVSNIGSYCISMFHENRIGTVIKHIPGHGLAKVDSHKKLPRVDKSTNYLNKVDFLPFKNKKSIFAMTAHIIFKNQDPQNCVTHSKKMIHLIRKKIGYKNLIISDDISMKALKYSITENTKRAFTAGCNLVLHCNGNLKEMVQVAKNSPTINNHIIKKTSQFIDIIS
tara:strand:+ start:3975 stop:4925 length:951 start_codon:yes stop_codon:yes gene_type:complete